MKKNTVFLIFLFFGLNVQGQVWIDHGATWHYEWSGVAQGGFVKIKYTKDTVIFNKNCQKLVPIWYSFYEDQNQTMHLRSLDTLNSEFTTVSGDTVFYLLNNHFYVLYNFGAQPGDTWNLGIDTNNWLCSHSRVIVDSIGTIKINNYNYRWIFVRTMQNSSVFIAGKVVERFGAINGGLFPQEHYCDTTIIVDGAVVRNLMCFEDTSFSLYNLIGKDCEYLLNNIKTEELITPNITITPNPTSDYIFIRLQPNYTITSIQIYDTQGILKMNNKSKYIVLKEFSEGVYYIKITLSSGQIIVKKIIKINAC